MKKWNVYGSVQISVISRVEAETAEEAIEKAHGNWGGMTNYAGNGGTDKLVGVYGDESIEADDSEPNFTEAEEADD